LWIKSRKDIGGVGDEFKDFVDRLESLFSDILGRQMGYRERLEYITNLDPVDVKIFDFYLVSLEARKVFNMAVKQFHEGRFSNALDLFLRSSKINPDSPLVYWNLARLGRILGLEDHRIIENYKKSLKLMKNEKHRKRSIFLDASQ